MKIKISKYIYGKIEEFAQKRIQGSKNLYTYRGEKNNDKMINDIIVGTLGEYGVYQLISKQGLKCTKPDLKIYTTKRKSFAADLFASNSKHDFSVHVKSQSLESEKRYGRSWLFQRSDSLVNAPELCDYMAFTNVDLETREVELLGYVSGVDIGESNLWGECRVPRYRHSKVAVYLDDLEPEGIVKAKLCYTKR